MYRILAEHGEPANAATSGLIRSITNMSCWRGRPMNCGRGISPSCSARRVDLLLSVCDSRCFQPLRCRLDGRAPRKRGMARKLIEDTCRKQQIEAGQLTIHADRGSSMTSKPVAFLLADLGITKTHSRPDVSDDNPYSESQFRTMKYRPDFPDRFGSIQTAARILSASSPGTTMSIGIPALVCSPRPWSTTARPTISSRSANSCSMPHTWRTPSASSGGHPNRSLFQRRSGSTNQTRHRLNDTKLLIEVSQTH